MIDWIIFCVTICQHTVSALWPFKGIWLYYLLPSSLLVERFQNTHKKKNEDNDDYVSTIWVNDLCCVVSSREFFKRTFCNSPFIEHRILFPILPFQAVGLQTDRKWKINPNYSSPALMKCKWNFFDSCTKSHSEFVEHEKKKQQIERFFKRRTLWMK